MAIARVYLFGAIPLQRRKHCAVVYEPSEVLAPKGSPWRYTLQWRDGFWMYRRWVQALVMLFVFSLRIED
jgi:hypothetical protein